MIGQNIKKVEIDRDVLFEYHRAVVPFCWAVRPVKSLSLLTGIPILVVFQNLRCSNYKMTELDLTYVCI